MYEIRIKLPHLSDANPSIERMKRELILSAANGNIPSYCMSSGDTSKVTLVQVADDPSPATSAPEANVSIPAVPTAKAMYGTDLGTELT